MKYALAVYAAPDSHPANQTALAFARALIAEGHSLYRLFFYHEGVHTGTRLAVPPQDETDLSAEWRQLVREQRVDAVVCIAASLRRGLLNAEEARRYERDTDNLAGEWDLSGLGQWVDAVLNADRFITFGA